MRSRNTILLILFSIVAHTANAQDSLRIDSTWKEKKWFLSGYVKDMQSVIFGNIRQQWITGNLIHNRLNFKWTPTSSIKLGIEARNRFFYGDMMHAIPAYGATFEDDKGIVKASKNLFNEKSFVLNTAIDRFYVDYTLNKFELTIGRQRINWGQTFVWNPNDIFNTYSYFDFDYEEKPGSDAIRMQYYSSETSKIEVTAKIDNNKKYTAAALYKINRWSYDFQIMGGIYNSNDYVIGGGWAGQVAKGGFRGEMTYFRPKANFSDTSGVFVASVGYDYTFKNSLMIQTEAIYNSNKTTVFSANLANPFPISAKNPFLSEVSIFGSVAYPFSPLIKGSIAAIYNPKSNIYFIIPTIAYSLSDNLDISLIAQSYQLSSSSYSVKSMNMVFLRLKGSF